MSTIYRVTPEERVEGQPTSGIVREQAVETAGMWAGLARTDAGMVSGWHHHGEYESAIYILTGSLRMEFGSAGEETFDAEPGELRLRREAGRAPREQPFERGGSDRGGACRARRTGHQRRRAGIARTVTSEGPRILGS